MDPEAELGVERLSGPFGTAPRWIGVLPYEACRHLERPGRGAAPERRPAPPLATPRWLRYPAVAVVTDHVLVVGDERRAVDHLARLLERPARVSVARARLREPEPAPIHARRIEAALAHIARGEIYQVNLARRFELEISGSTLELFAVLSGAAPAPYAFMLELGALGCAGGSPELFLRTTPDGRLLTAPIKGTRPRGADAVTDARQREELDQDEKERAELVMVVDLERNDLGRVARSGSVRLLQAPQIRTLPTLHHRFAVVGARLAPGRSRAEILGAMLPSGSVTGAPKVRAMELIAELEAHRRGLYTGAYGVLHRDGTLSLAMAIRTLVRDGDRGEYFSGGGIVADSSPEREVLETAWKARQLAALWGEAIAVGPAVDGDADHRKLVRFLPAS